MLRKLMKLTSDRSYNYLKYCTQVRSYATDQEQKEFDVAGEHQHKVNAVLGKYTEQEEEKILKILNNYNLNDLLGYDISKVRANKLLSWRTRNGLLSNLNDIFLVEGFGLKVADKLYQSLLEDPKSRDAVLGKVGRVKRTAPFITPHIEAEQQSTIKSCVSVRIGVNSISWAKLELSPAADDQPCQLSHWNHHEISERKLHLYELLQRCLYINHLIPSADCYIFENPQMAQASNNPGSVEQQNISIQKSQVTAIMGYSLAARNSQMEQEHDLETTDDEKMPPKRISSIFYVRRFLTARLFNHLVGTERISSEETILNMMRTYYNTDEMQDFINTEDDAAQQQDAKQKQNLKTPLNFRGNVQFPMELRQMFSKSPRYHREFLGQALLLNLAFVRLVLLQHSESIAKVTRVAKNKNESNDES